MDNNEDLDMTKECLQLACKLDEAIEEFGTLLGSCIANPSQKDEEFVRILQQINTLAERVLNREQTLLCFLAIVKMELESFIGHHTATLASEGDQK